MTIKKLVSFVALSMLAVTGWSQPEPMRSTLSFDKTRTIDIKSTTALVNVTVNATALKGEWRIKPLKHRHYKVCLQYFPILAGRLSTSLTHKLIVVLQTLRLLFRRDLLIMK